MFNFPWGKTYKIRCCDGSTRTIHKDLDHACPLYIQGWKADASAGIKGISDLSGEAKLKYESQIENLLFGLNEQNQSLMMSFRTVYLVFGTNPCANDGFFMREIEKLLDEQRKITALRMQIAALVQLATQNPNDTAALTKIFSDIASRLGGATVADAASMEIAEMRNTAKKQLIGE
jgi:hypothetical protein